MRKEVFDVIGVGFGPANLALAIAFEELAPGLSVRFLEACSDPVWQGEMLLDGANIQNNPIRDLVTLRNPRSRYTFINYLFEEGRLLQHPNCPPNFLCARNTPDTCNGRRGNSAPGSARSKSHRHRYRYRYGVGG
jgi:lysine/ornithine N-monooxygenase